MDAEILYIFNKKWWQIRNALSEYFDLIRLLPPKQCLCANAQLNCTLQQWSMLICSRFQLIKRLTFSIVGAVILRQTTKNSNKFNRKINIKSVAGWFKRVSTRLNHFKPMKISAKTNVWHSETAAPRFAIPYCRSCTRNPNCLSRNSNCSELQLFRTHGFVSKSWLSLDFETTNEKTIFLAPHMNNKQQKKHMAFGLRSPGNTSFHTPQCTPVSPFLHHPGRTSPKVVFIVPFFSTKYESFLVFFVNHTHYKIRKSIKIWLFFFLKNEIQTKSTSLSQTAPLFLEDSYPILLFSSFSPFLHKPL